MNNLSITDLKLINALPVKFTKKDGKDICNILMLSPRYFEIFTRKKCFKKHFTRLFHGVYIKNEL